MEITLLQEPLIEFADKFLCDDPKKGITQTGFYSLSHNSHNSEIHYAVIGTNQNIEDFKNWIQRFQNPIEATAKEIKIKDNTEIEDDGSISDNNENQLFDDDFDFYEYEKENSMPTINKKLNPDFPGFNKNSVFHCEFLLDDSNVNSIKKSDIDLILKSKTSNKEKLTAVIDLYVNAYQDITEYANKIPNICYFIIPSDVFKKLGSIQNGKYYLNFRRQLKARIFACNPALPIQIVLEDTITEKKKSMQDLSMTAWNFVVAQYYKTDNCIPWTLTDVDSDTCFIGISFHKILDNKNKYMRSSIAQAFNKDGKGLIFTGKQFQWNSLETKVSTPHLKYDYAKELIYNALTNYVRINKHTPKRVVIHKTSDFWDSHKNKNYAEIDGFAEGIREALNNTNVDIDYVTIKTAKQKLFREKDKYPVMRGTLLKIDNYNGVLYTTGYIPYYESYPGVHIPMGLHIETIGETTLKQICEEILALTKLNCNNCNYYSSLPITLQFSHRVGEILQYLPEGIEPPNRYFYYM